MSSHFSSLEKTAERQTLVVVNEESGGQEGASIDALRENRKSISKTVSGVDAAGEMIPVEAQNLMLEYLNVPSCPENFADFVEDTSLERLVFWKLSNLFEKVEDLEGLMEVVLAHVERPLFALALDKTKGNQSKASKVLGCNRNTLHRKLKGLSIQPMELRRAIKARESKRSRRQKEI